jgi:hypothetical protein
MNPLAIGIVSIVAIIGSLLAFRYIVRKTSFVIANNKRLELELWRSVEREQLRKQREWAKGIRRITDKVHQQ